MTKEIDDDHIRFPYPPTRSPVRVSEPEPDFMDKHKNKLIIAAVILSSSSACCSLVAATASILAVLK